LRPSTTGLAAITGKLLAPKSLRYDSKLSPVPLRLGDCPPGHGGAEEAGQDQRSNTHSDDRVNCSCIYTDDEAIARRAPPDADRSILKYCFSGTFLPNRAGQLPLAPEPGSRPADCCAGVMGDGTAEHTPPVHARSIIARASWQLPDIANMTPTQLQKLPMPVSYREGVRPAETGRIGGCSIFWPILCGQGLCERALDWILANASRLVANESDIRSEFAAAR